MASPYHLTADVIGNFIVVCVNTIKKHMSYS